MVDVNTQGLAIAARNSASEPLSTTIYATAYGVIADGVTANDTALYNAIQAAQTAASTSASAQFCEVVLPAGVIRITKPLMISNSLTALKFRIRGAGTMSTEILADFFTANAAPQFALSGGGGSGAVLYPIFYFDNNGHYMLSRVFIATGGTGYTSAPTATLVAATGSGASVTLTVSGGAVTGATVNAGGSGYPNSYCGDALVVIGSNTEVSDLSVTASAARAAAGNGGNSAYPYFTTNNGIRYEPVDPGYLQTVTQNKLVKVQVSGHPGHGINAARQEQWRVDHVISTSNGADGLFLNTDGFFTSGAGISNTFVQYRATGNYCRGLSVYGMAESTYIDCCIFDNLQGAGAIGYPVLSGGVVQSVLLGNSGAGIASTASAILTGGGSGTGASITPTIVGGVVTSFTVNSGGSGYTTSPSGASTSTVFVVSVPNANGLPSGVNEEVYFYNCSSQNFYGDVELNTGGGVGHDAIRLSGSAGCTLGGYWRGGRYGVYLNTANATMIGSIYHYGNAQDYTGIGIFVDSGSNQAPKAPFIANYFNASNVNITLYSTNNFIASGNVGGNFYHIGLIGSIFPTTASSTFSPSPTSNGRKQVVTLTGNVTISDTSNHTAGSELRLILQQDTVGGRSVTFNAAYVADGTKLSGLGSGTANQVAILDFECVVAGGRTIWRLVNTSGWA